MILRWIRRLFGHDTVSADQDTADVHEAVLESERTFKYKYMDFPFGEWKYFGVTAESQEEANEKAIERFRELFLEGYTVMTVFYPVKSK